MTRSAPQPAQALRPSRAPQVTYEERQQEKAERRKANSAEVAKIIEGMVVAELPIGPRGEKLRDCTCGYLKKLGKKWAIFYGAAPEKAIAGEFWTDSQLQKSGVSP